MIDFSEQTETRDGTPIVAGPWRQPDGCWRYVYQTINGFIDLAITTPKGVQQRIPGLDLIPPEPEWEWRPVFSNLVGSRWGSLSEALDRPLKGSVIGVYRHPKDCTDVTQWEYMSVEKAKELEGIE